MPFAYTFEPLGWVPRSLKRTWERFFSQLGKTSSAFALQEFRLSRYQALAALKCLVSLFFVPGIFRVVLTQILLLPIIRIGWGEIISNFILTKFHQLQMVKTAQRFEEVYFFDSLLHLNSQNQDAQSLGRSFFNNHYHQIFNQISLTAEQQSFWSFVNICGDIITCFFLLFLWFRWTPQRIIVRSFLIESLYSLRDEWRAFLLILTTDLLVGFHSSRGWELFLTSSLVHLGQGQNTDIVGLFVSTFPVLLDTVFKYWIFRYLNKISPSTVATYQSMLE